MQARKRYTVSWQKVLGFVIALLLSLELALRLFLPPAFGYYRALKDLHESHPDYLVALAPNADVYIEDNKGLWEGRFRTNSLSMRGSREPQRGLPKLACLGDSIVMGFGVSDEEAFCTLLDGIELGGRPYQSLNLSVDAFGSRGYARRLDEVSRMMPLDIVLLFVSPNDYTMPEDLRARGIRPDDETDAVRFSDPSYLRLFRYRFFLTKHSYLAHAILVSMQQLAIRSQLLVRDIRSELVHTGLLPYDAARDGALRHKPGLWNYIRYAFYRPPPKPDCSKTGPKPASDKKKPPKAQNTGGSTRNRQMKKDEYKFTQTSRFVSEPPRRQVQIDGKTEKRKKETRKKSQEKHSLIPFTNSELESSCPQPIPAHLRCTAVEPKVLPKLLPQTRRYYDEMIRLSKKRGFLLLPVFLPIQDEALYCTLAKKHAPLYNYALQARRYFQSQGVPTIDLRAYLPGVCAMKKENGDALRVRDLYILGDGHYTKYGNRWAARAIATALRDFFTKKQGFKANRRTSKHKKK